jgi:hypothetical protein
VDLRVALVSRVSAGGTMVYREWSTQVRAAGGVGAVTCAAGTVALVDGSFICALDSIGVTATVIP